MKYISYSIILSLTALLALPVARLRGEDQSPGAEGARALIRRILGSDAKYFEVEIIPRNGDKDVFELETDGPKVILRGNNGTSVASALNYYLKYYAQCDIGWNGTNLDLPHPLPPVTGTVRRTSPYKYRYYFNYCTFNYTMSWWDWRRWEREIDFMALNGINLPLALTGQNAVLRRVYHSLGFSDKDLEGFYSGPAYFSWFWMGNLDGWGGPLPLSIIEGQEALEKKILARERELGMTPILPAFTGHVPAGFRSRFPHARLRQTNWRGAGFPDVFILDPDTEEFTDVGTRIIREGIKTFGTDHFYSADTFNENPPPTNDPEFLRGVSQKVYQSMAAVDPQATWVMQGWLFVNAEKFWQRPQARAILDAVPDDHMVMLDLWAETRPVWGRTEAFYGKPWIWCMLHNFGGNTGLFGRLDEVAHAPADALRNPAAGNMRGIGLTPEGMEQNPALYELMLENAWTDQPIDVATWLKGYARRRYGRDNPHALEAWRILSQTVYKSGSAEYISEPMVARRPAFVSAPIHEGAAIAYRPEDLAKAWDALIAAADDLKASDGFQYDLVDVTRQMLADYGDRLHKELTEAYQAKNLTRFKALGGRFIALIDDLDRLLQTRRDFLLGVWLNDAKRWGANPAEISLCERNARDLITLWGGPDSRLHDYSHRQWAGLLKDFYRPRWEQFFRQAAAALQEGRPFDQESFDRKIEDWEWRWVNGHESYPATPKGDAVVAARQIYRKYGPIIRDHSQ